MGPAGTGAGGPVVTESKTPTATDGTGASGSRSKQTDAPVMPEFCFQSGNNRITVSGPAETGTGGPVGIEKGRSLRDGSDEIGMRTGTGAGGPILAGARFTTVAEVYAPIAGTEIVQRNDVGRSDQIEHVAVELSDSDKLGCLSITRGFRVMWGSDRERWPRWGRSHHESGRDPADVRHGTDADIFWRLVG